MQVELDAFSGLPNPRWELTPDEGREFRRRLDGLPDLKGSGAARQDLGYRGLIVRSSGDDGAQVEEVLVSNGTVVWRTEDSERSFQDLNRELERWLVETMRGRVDERLRTWAIAQLAGD